MSTRWVAPDDSPVYSVAQVAALLGTTRQTVYAMMRDGLPSVEIGKKRLIRRKALEGYLAAKESRLAKKVAGR